LPEVEPDVQKTPIPDTGAQGSGADAVPSGPEFVPRQEFEALRQEHEVFRRELARTRQPFVIRLAEKVVSGLIVAFIMKVLWEHTPAGDYAGVVVDKIEVVIEGVTYVLPYVP